MILRALPPLLAVLAVACDPVPDLYVVDAFADGFPEATIEASAPGKDAGEAADSEDAPGDSAPVCTGVRCPDCPPNPGGCCANDVPCYGADCNVDCTASQCTRCEGFCCSKQGGGPPTCHMGDSGKCPP